MRSSASHNFGRQDMGNPNQFGISVDFSARPANKTGVAGYSFCSMIIKVDVIVGVYILVVILAFE